MFRSLLIMLLFIASCSDFFHPPQVVILGATPGGIMAAIAAARGGLRVVLLERTAHIGGLPANGLGATDIQTRGATGGLFLEFVGTVKKYYVDKYGSDSQQVHDCSEGYHFEPHVAEMVFENMLAQYPNITILKNIQFDAKPENVRLKNASIQDITLSDRISGKKRRFQAPVFIDATYEGDLAAAAGCPFRIGREDQSEFNEPLAGVVYKQWNGPVGAGSTGNADTAIQAYNFRLCLTKNPDNISPVSKPENYNRAEYLSMIDDVIYGRTTGDHVPVGIWRVVNMVNLPNGKTDSNNQHYAFISTDLPEENWQWPKADWTWRENFAKRLKEYTLGLLWFAQNDTALPPDFREQNAQWGLAADEYTDNACFPRQVYVREGRRLEGEYFFTAFDALPETANGRPPMHQNSITASHYAIDSHAVRKREPGRVHLDGFLSHPTKPYTVPYGVILPKNVDNLLTPVPVSGSHLGFSTLRMEPCWMAMGQAAGTAAALSIRSNQKVKEISVAELQSELLDQGAVLIFYSDMAPQHPAFAAVQYFGLRGLLPEWTAAPDKAVTETEAQNWIKITGVKNVSYLPKTTRGELLRRLYNEIKK